MSILVGRKDGRFEIKALEIHITHACNLHCDGCRHYSNYNHKGELSLDQYKDWLSSWAERVTPRKFRLLGGEPTLNQQLVPMIYYAAELWPDATRQLTTNGYFLHRHEGLIEALTATNTRVALTIHSKDPTYMKRVREFEDALNIHGEKTGVNLFHNDRTDVWSHYYKGVGSTMRPFDDKNPRQSWEKCPCRFCPQIHENRLWKCPPIAYLPMQLKKFGLTDHPQWRDYARYDSLGLEGSDAEFEDFLTREEEPICGMCPANPVYVQEKTMDWKKEFRVEEPITSDAAE
ncbi:radical SAM protein [Oceanibacterium hippocampi]|uniref:Molybdenum cofactor biosynthesis protein A n=1 Tax=Oceanibacterium hippocampi TaxID=745714 RepID=A0A1Y5SS07_9PROT|nr:radical SAM protein [Oceanibacterium hippocampi]SLN45624.1 molybdenum cofactor biosynthesis protein A [Oceanibacterium hippocampi]